MLQGTSWSVISCIPCFRSTFIAMVIRFFDGSGSYASRYVQIGVMLLFFIIFQELISRASYGIDHVAGSRSTLQGTAYHSSWSHLMKLNLGAQYLLEYKVGQWLIDAVAMPKDQRLDVIVESMVRIQQQNDALQCTVNTLQQSFDKVVNFLEVRMQSVETKADLLLQRSANLQQAPNQEAGIQAVADTRVEETQTVQADTCDGYTQAGGPVTDSVSQTVPEDSVADCYLEELQAAQSTACSLDCEASCVQLHENLQLPPESFPPALHEHDCSGSSSASSDALWTMLNAFAASQTQMPAPAAESNTIAHIKNSKNTNNATGAAKQSKTRQKRKKVVVPGSDEDLSFDLEIAQSTLEVLLPRHKQAIKHFMEMASGMPTDDQSRLCQMITRGANKAPEPFSALFESILDRGLSATQDIFRVPLRETRS